MPKSEFLPSLLSSLSQRQACSVSFEEYASGTDNIVNALSKICGVPFVASLNDPSVVLAPAQLSATAVLSMFEEGSADNETLTVLAENQLDFGRFALAEAIFEIIAYREFRALSGPPRSKPSERSTTLEKQNSSRVSRRLRRTNSSLFCRTSSGSAMKVIRCTSERKPPLQGPVWSLV